MVLNNNKNDSYLLTSNSDTMIRSNSKKCLRLGAVAVSLACLAGPVNADATPAAVLETYADIALAGYTDSLTTAKALQEAVDALAAEPTAERLEAARDAWRAARVPYMQTEVYRFGNAIVDDWEGKVNAWPLDEGLIDYVDASTYGTESDENAFYAANVIANTQLTMSGETLDASTITVELLQDGLQEADENEANVATGYHAVEFLLWGQDLNGTGPGAGNRPATDFDPANCTGGNCARRVEFLQVATALLVDDLAWMMAQWEEGGAAREAVMADENQGLQAIITGMGSLSYGELAGERMQLGLILHDPEEEHDCFADNTHASHYYDALGIQNVFLGRYERIDGSTLSGTGLSDLLAANDAGLAEEIGAGLGATMSAMQALVDSADAGEAYDQMLGADNAEGNARVQAAIDALVAQTRSIEKAIPALGLDGIEFEGSDSLDAPESVGS